MNSAEFIKRDLSRRQFLGRSAKNAAGMAAGMVGLSTGVALAACATSRLRIAVIGVRNQGRQLACLLADEPNVEVAVLCDVDQNLEAGARKAVCDLSGRDVRWEADFRRVLDDSSIDAVVIATPDHWHAIMGVLACQAGKDVYLEKPVSHTIEEGQRLVIAARKFGRVMQTGLQQRSGSHFQSAVELVQSGKLGQVRLAKAWFANARKPIGHRREDVSPTGLDYDLWLGPAPTHAFTSNRSHYNWRAFWDYGTGELGNWGVHLLDVARWGLGVDLPQRVSASGGKYVFDDDQETPDTLHATFSYPQHTILWEHRSWTNHGLEGRGSGVSFHGERGTLVVDRSGWKVYDSDERLTSDTSEQSKAHLRNFLECVRSRWTPTADIEIGHVSTTLCHLGNIAWRVGHEVSFDVATQTFGADSAANALLTKSYRAPWSLPVV